MDPAMIEARLDGVVAEWRCMGVFYGGPDPDDAAQPPVDLERLLLRSVELSVDLPRLFNTTASWLHEFGATVALHRLNRLVRSELEPDLQALLGAMLDTAEWGRTEHRFEAVVCTLSPAVEPGSPFRIGRDRPEWIEHFRRRSGDIGRRWRLYLIDDPPRSKVLRATSWIMQRHPDFAIRAEFNGDLRASIMASLWSDEGAGESEAELARCCGGTVEEVRSVLPELERTERVARRDAVQGPRFVALVPKDHAERPGP